MNKGVATDSEQATYLASSSSDGNATTRWSANDTSTGHWCTVNLGASMNVTNGTQVVWEKWFISI